MSTTIDEKFLRIKEWLMTLDESERLETRMIWFLVELGYRFPEFGKWYRRNYKNKKRSKANVILLKA